MGITPDYIPLCESYLHIAKASPEQAVHVGWLDLVDIVNRYITVPGGLTPSLAHNGLNERPKLHITSRLGFIRAVWMEIAQLISVAHKLYCCDGCGEFYKRTEKKPKTGQRNYCPDCGKDGGYRHSKQEYKALQKAKK